MGEIDINVKNFIKLNSVFAQLFSKWVYKGEVTIEPDKLQKLDTATQETLKLEDGQLKSLERLRDAQRISMMFNEKIAFQIIMGIEGQTGVHYYMPVAAWSWMHCHIHCSAGKYRKRQRRISGSKDMQTAFQKEQRLYQP